MGNWNKISDFLIAKECYQSKCTTSAFIQLLHNYYQLAHNSLLIKQCQGHTHYTVNGNNTYPASIVPNTAQKIWIRKIYNSSGKTVAIWKNRKIRATKAIMSLLWKLFNKFYKNTVNVLKHVTGDHQSYKSYVYNLTQLPKLKLIINSRFWVAHSIRILHQKILYNWPNAKARNGLFSPREAKKITDVVCTRQ